MSGVKHALSPSSYKATPRSTSAGIIPFSITVFIVLLLIVGGASDCWLFF